MRALLERYMHEGREVHIHLARDFHLTGRLRAVEEDFICLARDDVLYHMPIDKILYVFERVSASEETEP
jgi:hypothetical protein